ncbi:tail assembly chaperone [Streptomyces phage Rooney]|jgi:hypothetical protein|nr:tail assembly chaperone [Streptomyces phage Gibson]QYW07278.1 tail assembly chaperone [Streptomyces phage Rooney]
MALVTKKQISEAVDRKWEDVPVPEWGGDVRLMELSAADRGYIEAGSVVANGQTPQFKIDSLKVYREKLVGMAMVDENFERVYSNKEIAAGVLGTKSGAVIERLAAKVQEMSGMGRFAVKEAEGNSEAAPSDSSASA